MVHLLIHIFIAAAVLAILRLVALPLVVRVHIIVQRRVLAQRMTPAHTAAHGEAAPEECGPVVNMKF
jgi:hypothetical protein